jgi:hypothetical protein
MIPRYTIYVREIHREGGMFGEVKWTDYDLREEEHPEGQWVKWEDVRRLWAYGSGARTLAGNEDI